jgi:hypothetical protein
MDAGTANTRPGAGVVDVVDAGVDVDVGAGGEVDVGAMTVVEGEGPRGMPPDGGAVVGPIVVAAHGELVEDDCGGSRVDVLEPAGCPGVGGFAPEGRFWEPEEVRVHLPFWTDQGLTADWLPGTGERVDA